MTSFLRRLAVTFLAALVLCGCAGTTVTLRSEGLSPGVTAAIAGAATNAVYAACGADGVVADERRAQRTVRVTPDRVDGFGRVERNRVERKTLFIARIECGQQQ
jgi:hypothetical protein